MTEASTSAYDKFIIESAEQYLRTVVLIDDQIYENERGSVASHLTKPPAARRKAALKSATSSLDKSGKEIEKAEVPEEPNEVSFHDVQNSFAKKRIICSLYQPEKKASFGEQSEVYELCSTADVVIVDWDLDDPSGDKATKLVGGLVEHSQKETPQQLRLVLIYTQEQDLAAVAKKIIERLGINKVDVDPHSEGLVLKTDNARVVVLGKHENADPLKFKDYWVSESELATRTIWEFSQLASGLLQGIVLRGIAKLRENNLRILTRFHKELDIAFLTHRALLLPDKAFRQIIPLLTDELRAVLEDTHGESPLGNAPSVKRILHDWCDEYWKTRTDDELIIGDRIYDLEFVKDVVCNEPVTKTKKNILKKNWNADDCHERLGSLMSQRVRYGNSRRTLHLGVIVREMADEKRYLLCMQPVCDSVRMVAGNGRTFVFCIFDIPTSKRPLTHCVLDDSGNVIKLRYNLKVTSIFILNFKSDDDAVCAKKDGPNRFVFKDEDGNDYEWIAELKTEHAQRAAEQFGRELSRVGLTESEWLRNKAE